MLKRDFHFFFMIFLATGRPFKKSVDRVLFLLLLVSRGRNFFIRTLNHTILVSTETPHSLKSAHVNEGAIEEHHTSEMITCFMQLHDDFTDFSSISLISAQWLA